MAAQATWMPSTEYGKVHNRAELPESVFAFPRQRKEPLTDASHVKNALARFDQGAFPASELAFANIKKAAQYYGVDVKENSWRELGRAKEVSRQAISKAGGLCQPAKLAEAAAFPVTGGTISSRKAASISGGTEVKRTEYRELCPGTLATTLP